MVDKEKKLRACPPGLDPELARQAVYDDWYQLCDDRMEAELDDPWQLLAPPREYPLPDSTVLLRLNDLVDRHR